MAFLAKSGSKEIANLPSFSRAILLTGQPEIQAEMLESVDRFKRAIRVAGGLWEEKLRFWACRYA